jgi:putative ATPase
MERRQFYKPKPVGTEARVKERLDHWAQMRKTKQNPRG